MIKCVIISISPIKNRSSRRRFNPLRIQLGIHGRADPQYQTQDQTVSFLSNHL